MSEAIHDCFEQGSGAFQHGHTYLGHPMAAAAALAVQEVIAREQLLSNVVTMGQNLHMQLQARFEQHPHIGDLRGRGLFRGVELVADRDSKAPFGAEKPLHTLIKSEAMERGLMVYPGSGTIDGRQGHHVLLAPPYIINAQQIEAIVERLADSIDAAIAKATSR